MTRLFFNVKKNRHEADKHHDIVSKKEPKNKYRQTVLFEFTLQINFLFRREEVGPTFLFNIYGKKWNCN